MVAALVTAASDSVASEAGQAWGRTTWHLSRGRVPPGTTGGVSIAGTATGFVAILMLTMFAVAVHLASWREAVAIAPSSFLAVLAEGFVISRMEDAGLLNNDEVNLVATVVAATAAIVLTTHTG